MRVLVVGAHPDDAEVSCGGTIARWTAAGAHVEILVLTDGRLGSWDASVDPAEVAGTRASECRAGAEALGVAAVRFGAFADGDLSSTLGAATELVAGVIRDVRPDVLASHDPWRLYELHPDHRATGTAVCDGMIKARESHGIAGDERPAHRPSELWLWASDHPTRFVDVEAVYERKLESLAAHASQLARAPDWRGRVSAWNARIGAERGYRFAEAFKVLTPHSGPAREVPPLE